MKALIPAYILEVPSFTGHFLFALVEQKLPLPAVCVLEEGTVATSTLPRPVAVGKGG